MKVKSILLLGAALAIMNTSRAQITLGPRAGVTFMKQGIGSPYEVYKPGTMLGGVVKVTIKDMMAVQAEMLLIQKGYREEFDGSSAYDELTARYLEIPVLFNYSIDFARFKPFVNAGPYLAFWRSASYESKIDGQEVLIEDYEFTNDFDQDGYKDNRLDYGLSIGFGLLYDRIGAAGNIVLDARYSKGLAPINLHETEPQGYTARYNTGFTISLAYLFSL